MQILQYPSPIKILVVGDVHAEQTELTECNSLVELIANSAKDHDFVVFMGDQHHNHALLHLEVLGFWKKSIEYIRSKNPKVQILTIVGNHDQPGNGTSKNHAMLAYDTLIPEKVLAVNNVAFISYCSTREEFLSLIAELPSEVNTLFVHQTFQGSKYENGFYAKDGFDLDGLEKFQIYSGHIHTPQQFANVTYVGAPRWRSVSDANVDRFLWSMLIDLDGVHILNKISTADVCQPMLHFEDKEIAPQPIELIEQAQLTRANIIVDLHGSSDWIAERSKVWPKCRIRTFPVHATGIQVQESKGVHVALREFLDAYIPTPSVTLDQVRDIVNKRLGLSL